MSLLPKAIQLTSLISLNRACLLCHQPSTTSLCDYCQADLPLLPAQQYDHDLLRLPRVKQGLHCASFDCLRAVADYTWPLANLITGLKFAARQSHAKALAKVFVDHALPCKSPLPELLLPVPLHSARYAQRKYNQAHLLATQIGRMCATPVSPSHLLRSQATQAQTTLNASQRQRNMRNAFALRRSLQDYRHIALVDDVITTGATLSALTSLIKHTYPQLTVEAWCICVTLTHQ